MYVCKPLKTVFPNVNFIGRIYLQNMQGRVNYLLKNPLTGYSPMYSIRVYLRRLRKSIED